MLKVDRRALYFHFFFYFREVIGETPSTGGACGVFIHEQR